MADTLTKAERSERMRRVRAKDSKAELVVRSLAHRLGYRFRLHRKNLPGTPDIVFPSRKSAIFVQGCFWHRHPDPDCKLARLPKTRLEFWKPKLEGNRKRDLKNQEKLGDLGWDVLEIWECEIRDMELIKEKLVKFLGPANAGC